MPQMQNLEYTNTVATSDQVVIWKSQYGQPMRLSVGALIDLAASEAEEEVVADLWVTINSAPDEEGAEVTITSGSDNYFVVIEPDSGYAEITVVFPAIADTADHQMIKIVVTNPPTTLTLDGNGGTIVGNYPAGTAYFALEYMLDKPNENWYLTSVVAISV